MLKLKIAHLIMFSGVLFIFQGCGSGLCTFAGCNINIFGRLDITFGVNGKVINTDPFPLASKGANGIISNNGFYTVPGTFAATQCAAVFQFDTTGAINSNFGPNAGLWHNGGFDGDQARNLIQSSNGNYFVVGDNFAFTVWKLFSNGDLDTSFGTGGQTQPPFTGFTGTGYGVFEQPDNKIVVAGGANSQFAVARLTQSGATDTTFGTAGVTEISFGGSGSTIRDLLFETNSNSYLLAGTYDDGTKENVALAKISYNGILDTTFGTAGKKIHTLPGSSGDSIAKIKTDYLGRIYLAGTSNNNYLIMRIFSNGDLDPSFGSSGYTTLDFYGGVDDVRAVAIQRDNKIILGGYATKNGQRDFGLARFLPSGAVDSSFGLSGKVTTDFYGDSDALSGLLILSDNKILAVGSAYDPILFLARLVLVRYH